MFFVCRSVPWVHSAILSHSPGGVVFHFSITAFVMIAYLNYKVRITGMTPLLPQNQMVKSLGSTLYYSAFFCLLFSPVYIR